MLKVGVLGLGVGQRHIEAYLSHGSCEISWICDLNEKTLNEVGRRTPRAKRTTYADEVLRSNDVDIISIATYDNYHFEQVKIGLELGRNVFVEKPICLTSDHLSQLRILHGSRREATLSANFVLRSCLLFQNVRKAVLGRSLGDIMFLEADYLWGRKFKLESGWRRKTPGYSIVLGAAIHMIDLVMWVLNTRPVTVEAMSNSIGLCGDKNDIDTFSIALMKFPDGTIAKVTGNGACVHPHFHKLEIYGTDGTFIHNAHETTTVLIEEGRTVQTKTLGTKEQYPTKERRSAIIHSFVDAVLKKRQEPIVRADQMFDVMAVGLAIEEALLTGHSVDVTYE